ncbi:hypothetical protein Cni_G19290 [Canna indica]|uniref:Uncharacterized protein n=1 Tax=Canna indica TaxID=4628 RepID=A0AAQ3KKC0_9LILI|nr:hypothetical protein Cni_G19290 [Canna indica]
MPAHLSPYGRDDEIATRHPARISKHYQHPTSSAPSFAPSPPPPPHPSVAAWWRTVRLYTDQTGANVSAIILLGVEHSDRRYSRGRALTRLDIQSVIHDAVNTRRRPIPVNPRGGLYLVLTSADVAMQDFCVQCPGSCANSFAVPPFAIGLRKAERPPNDDVGVDGMVSVVEHELAEMASNPLVNAWYTEEDPIFPTEIADLCEGISAALPLSWQHCVLICFEIRAE